MIYLIYVLIYVYVTGKPIMIGILFKEIVGIGIIYGVFVLWKSLSSCLFINVIYLGSCNLITISLPIFSLFLCIFSLNPTIHAFVTQLPSSGCLRLSIFQQSSSYYELLFYFSYFFYLIHIKTSHHYFIHTFTHIFHYIFHYISLHIFFIYHSLRSTVQNQSPKIIIIHPI